MRKGRRKKVRGGAPSLSPPLPISREEARREGIDRFDVVLVSGDGYVDHPSFGVGLIGRVLQDAGYAVGIIPQPDWRRDEDFRALGEPRLFFGVASGNVDSMVNNLSPNKKRRRRDVYSPGGRLLRPDRAAIVYANRVHSLFPQTPLILGGIEASLRRFAHYDFWSDSVRGSILADAPADLVVFGMGERPILEVARRLEAGDGVGEIRDVPGTLVKMGVGEWRATDPPDPQRVLEIPSFAEVARDKRRYAEAFRLHHSEQDPFRGRTIVQPHPKTVVIQNPPALPLTSEELDKIYELPFTRAAHPSYREAIPALEPVRFSITTHRGCFGSCSFCALTHHQGRIVQSRSIESVVREAERLTELPGFKGVIQDVGGPTANMYGMFCSRWRADFGAGIGAEGARGACADRLCSPDCPTLAVDHRRQVELLRRLREIPGVRRVFVSSGIRHDLILADQTGAGQEYLEEVCRHHVSGHLKVAPEHVSDEVLKAMHKPTRAVLEEFRQRFREASREEGKEQYLVPYFISGHPGCEIKDMVELAEYIRDHRLYSEQVQDFTPTPMTVSTCMYHSGIDPFSGKAVHVPRGREKEIQRALLQFRDRRNWGLVREGLRIAGREDLIGDGPRCLVPKDGGW
ncbi:YgiQ family radical SAM protein [Methanocrinis sp.]|uniref:YgiQ family radical SAM protein n=1 Tax=Methanocrinis sp. TaxID=3101522 RepID=UPI003D0D7D7F